MAHGSESGTALKKEESYRRGMKNTQKSFRKRWEKTRKREITIDGLKD